MKKAFALMAIIVISAHAVCQGGLLEKMQNNNGKIRYGLKAGLSVADLKIEYGSNVGAGNQNFKLGAIGCVFSQIPVNKTTIFQPELMLIGKGAKQKEQYYTDRIDLTYLELLLNLLYKPITSKGSFFIGGGPAPSYFIGENPFYVGFYEIKKFDFGINILTGYEWAIGFSVNLHYTYGLINISTDKTSIPLTKNRCFGVSVGYTF